MNDTIPQNIEVEENILGGILLDPSAMSRVIDSIMLISMTVQILIDNKLTKQ
jgi:replicative DNA helicase